MTTLPQSELDALHDTAIRAARAAREVTLSYFRSSDLAIQNKADGGFDPVTQADQEAERAIRKVLAACRPDDGIIGEEEDNLPSKNGLSWVIDPIDGTRGFMAGTPTWGTLISVGNEDGPILGLIDQPYIGERFIGSPDGALLRHGSYESPLAVRDCSALSDAVIFSTFPEVGSRKEAEAFHALAKECRLTRYGMDCYAYGLVAAGQADLVVEAGLHIYDIHAPIAVIEAAGGIVTDWQGNPVHQGGRVIAAGDKALHEQALNYLRHVTD